MQRPLHQIEPAPTAQTEMDSDAEPRCSSEMPFSERLAGDTDDSNTDTSSDAGEISDGEVLDTTTLWELVEPRRRPNLVQIKPGLETCMDACPMGLKHLRGLNKKRVVVAKFLYKWTRRLDRAGVVWSVENPASSLMWLTDPFVELVQEIPTLVAFSFHTCMFQAKRKKDTAIWTSISELRHHLERKCDGKHEHLAWGKVDTHNGFATAEECACNEHMCASWAQAIFDYAVAQGFQVPRPGHAAGDSWS